MSFLSKLDNLFQYALYEQEIKTEIQMLKQVLSSAGVITLDDQVKCFSYKEHRTLLISQMKYVIPIIEELQKIRTEFTPEFNENFELTMKCKKYEEDLLKLREENEFLKDSKEKIYILRERLVND